MQLPVQVKRVGRHDVHSQPLGHRLDLRQLLPRGVRLDPDQSTGLREGGRGGGRLS